MAGFNEFVETELPKRPFADQDAPAPGYVAVRDANMAAPRKLTWVAPDTIGTPRYVEMLAAVTLSGQRVVAATDLGAVYADAADISLANSVVGVTTGAADAGTTVKVQVTNALTEPSWNWVPGAVFVGANGLLTQTPPETGFSLVIGMAIAATTIIVNKQLPIIKL